VKPRRAELLTTNIKKRSLDAQRHMTALEAAASDFGDDFDIDIFARSWDSDDPQELKRAYAVQAGYENVLNNCVTIAEEVCELEGWVAANTQPNAVEALKLLHENGVIETKTREALKGAQERRTKVQHGYVNVRARDVHESATEVLDAAPLLLQGVADQLRQRQ